MAVETNIAGAAATLNSARAQVAGAIRQASGTTGTSFQYLLATAKMESDFDPKAAASTSSARGLFQFIEQTWLGTVKEAGTQFGYGRYAVAISKSASGSYSVSDPVARAEILKLRDDPAAASAMAGVLTHSNGSRLTGAIGRRPSDAELYMAHFMGVGGAAKLIKAAQERPQTSAAALFPTAAEANPSVFYNRAGDARSVTDVYSVLSARYAGAANSPATRTALATLGNAPISLAATATPIDNAAYLSSFPDVRDGARPEAAQVAAQTSDQPIFRTLFQAGDRAEPVSPAVQELWGNRSSLTAVSSGAPDVARPKPLDLFTDRSGQFSG